MKKERRCLKFTGYIFLPDANDLRDIKALRNYLASLGMGRLQFFNEAGKKSSPKMKAFKDIGDMQSIICEEFRKRVRKRI